MRRLLDWLQPIGRALMLPIAVLPAAGLLLRLGQPDLLNLPFMAAAGDAVFANLGLLFAVGVGVGLARDDNGAAGLAGVVCYLIASKGARVLIAVPPDAYAGLALKAHALAADAYRDKAIARLSVPLGVLSGLVAGNFYNRFATLKLPDYLAFFGGRRFVPIVSGGAGLALAAIFGFGYQLLASGMDALSAAIVGSGVWGLFAFGVLNRILIVTGLHHILNNVVYFLVGDYHGVTGDLNRFFAGDPTAGGFMTGFFPVMMFGLPGACLAMYRTALPERRRAVGGLLLSLALTSFLTGVTEPIEFSFMFLAPGLYALHALLTGAAMMVMHLLGVRLGYGFSAGLFDYLLNFRLASRPLLLLPVGAAYFALYYLAFTACIRRFDLKTPGREPVEETAAAPPPTAGERGAAFVQALGGGANLSAIGACTTRLRLGVVDGELVDLPRLKALGARGFIHPSPKTLQVVVGPVADAIAAEMRAAVASPVRDRPPQADVPSLAADPHAAPPPGLEPLLLALGGGDNVLDAARCGSRLHLALYLAERVDMAALYARGARAAVWTPSGRLHILLPPGPGGGADEPETGGGGDGRRPAAR